MSAPNADAKTAADRALEALARQAQDREQLRKKLRTAAEPVKPAVKRPWEVVRQYSHRDDELVCAHRWEWLAELCARRRTFRYATQTGVHFTARRTA